MLFPIKETLVIITTAEAMIFSDFVDATTEGNDLAFPCTFFIQLLHSLNLILSGSRSYCTISATHDMTFGY